VPKVTFTAITHDPVQRAKVLLREEAVKFFREKVAAKFGIEFSLSATVTHMYRRAEEQAQLLSLPSLPSLFACSTRALRSWVKSYELHGLNGLVEQKQGAVGRHSAMSKLSPEEHAAFKIRGQALASGYGSNGRINIARAARELATHPDLPSPLREHLHGAHASKSHVTPSIKRDLKIAPSTAVLSQMGTKAARLSSSRWTPGNYDNVKAGSVWCSDDMTSNVLCWVEWPNAQGFKIGPAPAPPYPRLRLHPLAQFPPDRSR
jgi:hypothetical protein